MTGMKNIRGMVQGFAIGATVTAALMLGLPALTAPASPSEDMDRLAATFGVEIVWTETSPCTSAIPDARGCYFAATPSRIYVSPTTKPTSMRQVVLHEIGHAIQGRLGLPRGECAADRFANSLGARMGDYCDIHVIELAPGNLYGPSGYPLEGP